jgi:hypothetical protein
MRKKIYILMILIGSSCASQKSIGYIFPEKVEEKIVIYFREYLKEKPKAQFYLTIDKVETNLYLLQINEYSTKSNDITSGILKKGNRYANIENKKIPIINSIDLNFIDLGKSPRGGIIRRAVLNHSYGFYMNYDGDIIKELK